MIVSLHQPEYDAYPGTAVVEPYGFMGNPVNSGPRLDIAARLANVTIIGLQRAGTRTATFDLGMRTTLHPTQYDQTIADQIEELGETLTSLEGKFDALAGHGMSAGGAPVAALARLGMFGRGVLFRDAVNLRATTQAERTVPGIFNFVRYLVVGELDKPAPPDDAPRVPHAGEVLSRQQRAKELITEIRHYHPLMLSTYTANAVRELADYPRLPMYYVGFGHTFTGSIEQAMEYATRLAFIREAAASRLRQLEPDVEAAGFQSIVASEYYHSDLVSRPDLAARHITEMLALQQSP